MLFIVFLNSTIPTKATRIQSSEVPFPLCAFASLKHMLYILEELKKKQLILYTSSVGLGASIVWAARPPARRFLSLQFYLNFPFIIRKLLCRKSSGCIRWWSWRLIRDAYRAMRCCHFVNVTYNVDRICAHHYVGHPFLHLRFLPS